jgi:hypothetical protein
MAINSRQRIFREWTSGTLIYAVVMGFFNDYTDVLRIESFSTVFLAALVMQALTFATFGVKKQVNNWYQGRTGTGTRIAQGFSIWAIMFSSKFVFLWVIDIVFGDAVEINSFVGLMLIIAVMVLVSRLIDAIDRKLGTADSDLTPSAI